jgi:hypothetical protein
MILLRLCGARQLLACRELAYRFRHRVRCPSFHFVAFISARNKKFRTIANLFCRDLLFRHRAWLMTRWVNFTLDPNFIIRIMVDSDPFGNIGIMYIGLVSDGLIF